MWEDMQIEGLRYVLEVSIQEITDLQTYVIQLQARIRELEELLQQYGS
jgi:hypothetical protein